MNQTEALNIVLDLAEQNVIDDPEMADERERQQQAIKTIRKLREPTVLVILSGGVIQNVATDGPVEVITLDYDQDGVSEKDAKNDEWLYEVDGKYVRAVYENIGNLHRLIEQDRSVRLGVNHAIVTEGDTHRILNATYTSEWDSGESVTSPCLYDIDRKLCFAIQTTDESPDGSLLREYVTLPDGKELDESDDMTFDY